VSKSLKLGSRRTIPKASQLIMRSPGVNRIGQRKFCILVIVAFPITGCSSSLPPVTYVPPSPPTEAAVISGIKAAASEAKLTAPLEMSAVRPTDRGPGSYFVCLKGTWLPSVGTTEAKDIPAREPSLFDPPPQPAASERRVIYSVFFDNDVYKDSRQSVIMDACETQAFTLIDLSPPPPPPPKSSKKNKR
jgi:hypothetical protein